MHMFVPYNLTMDIEKHFESTAEGPLEYEDFYNVVETLQATGSEKNQKRTAAFFMTLPKKEVILRASTVARLNKLLQTIKINRNVIPRTSAT